MKKLIIASLLIIIIPYIIVTTFIQNDEIKFKFVSNMNVRVKKEDNTVIQVPFEDYIVGVLAGEMPVSFEIEALKAQAVAARSYVMKKMEQNYENEYDVVDTVMNQVYLDETTLKEVIGTLSQMTGRPVSKEQEEKIINAVVNDQVPKNLDKYYN